PGGAGRLFRRAARRRPGTVAHRPLGRRRDRAVPRRHRARRTPGGRRGRGPTCIKSGADMPEAVSFVETMTGDVTRGGPVAIPAWEGDPDGYDTGVRRAATRAAARVV